MRSFDGATAAYFAGETDFDTQIPLWITVKDRATGAPYSLGLWTGDDTAAFSIGGIERIYQGAGAVLGLPALTYEPGLSVRNYTFTLAGLAPEVAEALRFYDPRLAPVEVRRACFYPAGGGLVATPYEVLTGFVDEVKINTPQQGGQGSATISVASSARKLTRTLPIYKSDEQQKLRSGDRFRRWGDISGSVDVFWGEKRGTVAPPAPPRPRPPGNDNDRPDGGGYR